MSSLNPKKEEDEKSHPLPPNQFGFHPFEPSYIGQGGFMMGGMGMGAMSGLPVPPPIVSYDYPSYYSYPNMGMGGYTFQLGQHNLTHAFQSLALNPLTGMPAHHGLEGSMPGDENAEATQANMAGHETDGSRLVDEVIGDELARQAEAAAHHAAGQIEEYDFSKLPPHACSYCGIHHPESVARCTSCNKWFCNSPGVTASSHLVAHMVRARHKTFALHPDSPLNGTNLECYSCGCRNVFLLGFVSAKADNVVVLLCRTPCLQSPQLKHSPWDLSGWTPLIQDKKVLDWLLPLPPAEAQVRARPLTAGLIARLEELWHCDPHARLEDLQRDLPPVDALEPVCVRFEDAVHYQHVMGPLVSVEAAYDRRMKELQSQDHVSVEWEVVGEGKAKRVYASFVFFQHEETSLRVVPGDELRLSYGQEGEMGKEPWEGEGSVIKVTVEGRITMVLFAGIHDAPTTIQHGYCVRAKWKSVAFDRMHQALHIFANREGAVGQNLYLQLLGVTSTDEGIPCEVPNDLRVPGLPRLNEFQEAAVRSVLTQTLSLVQGPPGTGKTSTSATIVYHLHKVHRKQVLVCAPSNVAVDHLTEKLHLTGLKVIRVSSRSRESVPSTVDFLSLHILLQQLAVRSSGDFAKLHSRYTTDPSSLSPRELRNYRALVRKAEIAILSKADIVCTTCAGAGDPRLTGLNFEHVLVDESTQAPEPECLVPLVSGAKQLVLVGDHCQLGPVILSKAAVAAGFNRSLFERLILLGHQPYRLQIQYRMHPALSVFPSNTFYDGLLQNGVSTADRTPARAVFEWPVANAPMVFMSSTGVEEYAASGTSYLNRQEATIVERLVLHLVQNGVQPGQIGIVTPYEGQRLHLLALFARTSSPVVAVLQARQQQSKDATSTTSTDEKTEKPSETVEPDTASILSTLNDLEIASVDSFQGREKDFIIFTCVRSNDHGDVGFLSDPRRLNVALTRARYGLMVVGNPRVLAKQPLWHALLTHFRRVGCLSEGPIGELRPCAISLPPPRLCISKRTVRIPVGFDPRTAFGMGNVLSQQRQLRTRGNGNGNGNGHSNEGRGKRRGGNTDEDTTDASAIEGAALSTTSASAPTTDSPTTGAAAAGAGVGGSNVQVREGTVLFRPAAIPRGVVYETNTTTANTTATTTATATATGAGAGAGAGAEDSTAAQGAVEGEGEREVINTVLPQPGSIPRKQKK